MRSVQPKKSLGQHFLKDPAIAGRIASVLSGTGYWSVLEIGPGMGILTKFLIDRNFEDLRVIEIDPESVQYLRSVFPGLEIIHGDFLALNLSDIYKNKLAVIGNFPYNISSQIMFRVLENRDLITEVAGMFQKEVAERICSGPGSKVYGILSVFLQAFYNVEYLFTVPEHVFNPPPKVKSGVIRLVRNEINDLGCDEKLFYRVVKSSFNQRRKTLRNSVRSAFKLKSDDCQYFSLRPEQLTVQQFIDLTNWVGENIVSE